MDDENRADEVEVQGGLEGVKSTSPFSEKDLNTRAGHQPDFLGDGIDLPLPKAGKNQTWLHYTHFSILMDRKRRQALLTVVDIDGAKWVNIKRRKPDVWYPDPRLKNDEQPEKNFFQKVDPNFNPEHNDFGFGHLVRRQDPNWDEPEDVQAAERSEYETFHLTNASPQAESLNSGPWNTLEDIVLDDIRETLRIPAVVLTGPIFEKNPPLLHGVFPIPREYWKIVAWRSGDGLAAVGWRQRQPDGVMPEALESVSVPFDGKAGKAWLIPIEEIAKATGLDLALYAAADTYRMRVPALEGMAAAPPALPLPSRASDLLMAGTLRLGDDPAPAAPPSDEAVQGLAAALADREAEEIEAEEIEGETAETSGAVLESLGNTPQELAGRVSARAFDLIVQHETGGRAYYETVYKKRPVWPKEKSGITIGFGYDLGYVTAAEFQRDWAALPQADRDILVTTIGEHAGKRDEATMQAHLARVKHVVVEWPLAEAVFRAATLPKFAASTNAALPNCGDLPGHCFGALVSLTFNRGASYGKAHDPAKDPKDRYREMRAIRKAMATRDFAAIPALIRAMRRIWEGTAIQKEMDRRRENEAALFEAGLTELPLAQESPAAVAGGLEAVSVATAGIPAMAETWTGPGDEDYWTDITEDDVATAAAAAAADGGALESAGAALTVSWAADADSVDYAHLVPTPASGAFSLGAEDLELLAALNDLPVDEAGDTPVLFGLRGCAIVKDHKQAPAEVILKDQRPDHLAPRCVLGVWNRRAGTVHVFPGSTVPDRRAVVSWKTSRQSGNLLPTGLYRYVVGPHATLRKDGSLNSRPGCFLLRNASGNKRVVVVRRSNDDLAYDLADMADRSAPGDNIHPTFFSQPSDFSSFGCQTVVGTADSGGNHRGAWAEFRAVAGLQDAQGTPGRPYLYMLLTGTEAMLASALRRNGLSDDLQARRALRRLRFGSKGDAVLRLQARLGVPKPDGDFGPFTAESLNALQRGIPPKNRCDGIWTPDLDAVLGWGVFNSFGV